MRKRDQDVMTDVYMETTHKKGRKAKTTFKMVMNKVLVSAVVLSNLASFAPTSAMANEMGGTTSPAQTVEYNYNASFGQALSNLQSTIRQVREMRNSGIVSDALLQKLTDEVRDLERAMIDESSEDAVRQSGVPQDVVKAWIDAGVVAHGIEGAGAVRARAAVDQMIETWNIGVDLERIANAVNGTTIVEVSDAKPPAEVEKPIETEKPVEAENPVETEKPAGAGETTVNDFKAVDFEDVKGHWGENTIRTLVGQDVIKGFPDGSFRPDEAISNEEFIAILMRTVTGKTYQNAAEGQPWSENIIQDARKKGIITRSDIPFGTYGEPITRADMARYTANTLTRILGEEYLDARNADKYIKDIDGFKHRAYANDVRQVYAKGIIIGKDDGKFHPTANTTRAEAATIIERIKDKGKRNQVDLTKKYDFDISITTPKVIDSRVEGLARNVKPMPGDTFIKADGTEVILKVGPRGVLGEGQGLDLYSGMTGYTGSVLKPGGYGTYFLVPEGTIGEYVSRNEDGVWMDGSCTGDKYYSDIHGNHHFESEWGKIKNYDWKHTLQDMQNPANGQRAGYGENYIYDGNSMTWTWDPMHTIK